MRFRPSLGRHKGLPTLLAGQVPADFADWLDFVAIGALLGFVWQVEPVVFAWLGVAIGLPYLIVGPVAGVLADRWDLRRVLILSNLGRAVATLALAFVGSVPALLAVAFLRGSIDSFFGPAKQAAIQAIVPEDDRLAANGVSHAINQASKVVGPSVGGALLIGLDPQAVFLANAVVSAVAAAILIGLPRSLKPAAPPGGPDPRSMIRELREGFAEVRTKPVVAVSLSLMAAGYFAISVYDAFIPLLVRAYGFEEGVFALAIAAVGAGGVAGALAVGALGRAGGGFGLIGAGCVVAGALVMGLGVAPLIDVAMPSATFVGVFALVGAATAVVIVPFRTLLQRHAEPSRMARVFAASEALNVTAMLGAPFIGALVADIAGTGAPFVAGGAVMMLLAVAAGIAALRFR
ncbi:MFS transporter [Salinarimonas rosea]|uniref:MFS transporter n=1 Tax=Salinarimonas rosea TaxID=552063 RepID=UPI00042515AC|nr:MFS transporter [Salinarimonas rosea]